MDKKIMLKKLMDDYKDNICRIEAAVVIANKIEPHLPEHWTIEYIDTWRGLLISRFHKTDGKGNRLPIKRTEFSGICGLVQQATGNKVIRNASTDFFENKEHLNSIQGWGEAKYTTLNGEKNTFDVQVRLYDMTDCRVTYEKKEIQVAVLSEGCLGILGKSKE